MATDWRGAGLVKESALKPVLTTIEQHPILRVIGRLAAADIEALRRVVSDVIG